MLLMLTTMVMLTIILLLMLIMWPRLTLTKQHQSAQTGSEDKENQTFHGKGGK